MCIRDSFRREPGHFFFYLLVNFTATLAMSHLFRSIGASTKTMSQAMTPSVILLLAFVIFTGFIIPTPDMHGWCRWINYINPIAYAFEALIANEFHDRDFICSRFVPSGGSYPVDGPYRICSVVGSVVGENYVNGDAFINESFKYYDGHKWRNWGIVLAFAIFFMFTYVLICEYNRGSRQKGEVLLFQKRLSKRKMDMEMGKMVKYTHEFSSDSSFEKNSKHEYSGNIFHWRHLSYSVKIKSENRIILDDIDGWVKPGQITALMGATGAVSYTHLDVYKRQVYKYQKISESTSLKHTLHIHIFSVSGRLCASISTQHAIHPANNTNRVHLQLISYKLFILVKPKLL